MAVVVDLGLRFSVCSLYGWVTIQLKQMSFQWGLPHYHSEMIKYVNNSHQQYIRTKLTSMNKVVEDDLYSNQSQKGYVYGKIGVGNTNSLATLAKMAL